MEDSNVLEPRRSTADVLRVSRTRERKVCCTLHAKCLHRDPVKRSFGGTASYGLRPVTALRRRVRIGPTRRWSAVWFFEGCRLAGAAGARLATELAAAGAAGAPPIFTAKANPNGVLDLQGPSFHFSQAGRNTQYTRSHCIFSTHEAKMQLC